MITAYEMLNKIKWSNIENADYSIYCYDSIKKRLFEVRFEQIKEIGKSFMVIDNGNKEIDIPLHRIREIRKAGKLVWSRR